jgi:hypothetical protein
MWKGIPELVRYRAGPEDTARWWLVSAAPSLWRRRAGTTPPAASNYSHRGTIGGHMTPGRYRCLVSSSRWREISCRAWMWVPHKRHCWLLTAQHDQKTCAIENQLKELPSNKKVKLEIPPLFFIIIIESTFIWRVTNSSIHVPSNYIQPPNQEGGACTYVCI